MKKPLWNHPRKLSAVMVALLCGVLPVAAQDERQPIISRMQVVYSMVSHYNHIPDRIAFYNSHGSPAGNINYAVPHLVYEPNVTLYNPYNTVLEIPKSRVRLWNPPVGFRFKKNNTYLRDEFASGNFLGLARFQIQNEKNANSQKFFTMILRDGTSEIFNGAITLKPGESRTFQVRVESSWTWGIENRNVYSPHAFFDWDVMRDFTNRDARTGNFLGAESVPGVPDYRAGFQTDSLSLASGRPPATLYPFESNSNYVGAWVAIKKTDTVSVEARGVDTVIDPRVPDFRLSLMRGQTEDASADTVRDFDFKIADLIPPDNQVGKVISRTFKAGDILQTPDDQTVGGKTPFATFTIAAKASALRQGLFLAETHPPTNQLYVARLDEMLSFDQVERFGASDGLASGMQVSGVERVGDSLMLDVASQAGMPLGRVMGTTDPALGFPDNLTASCVISPGPVGTGLFKVTVPVAGLGDRYFVRIER